MQRDVHFEAVPARRIRRKMATFLKWANKPAETDPVLSSAFAHFWFVQRGSGSAVSLRKYGALNKDPAGWRGTSYSLNP